MMWPRIIWHRWNKLYEWVKAQVVPGCEQTNILCPGSIKCMATKLDECMFYLTFIEELSVEEFISNGEKKNLYVSSHMNGPHQARAALAYSPFNRL